MSQIVNLNSQENDAIEELRSRLKNALSPDMYDDTMLFYRFLKARDFNINKAESMLRKHILWRKINKIENILEDFKPSPIFLNYVQGTYLGEDKEGCGVRYAATGNMRVTDIINAFKLNDYIKHWIWVAEHDVEQVRKANIKTGRSASKAVYIVNLDNLQFACAANPTAAVHWTHIAQLVQDNYPERLKGFYVINAPSYYLIIYSIVKRFLAAEVLRKIHIYGRRGWKEELLKVIDADVLPAFLGGNKTDPDGNPMCNTFVRHGGRIPPKYFLSKEDRSFKDKSRVRKITIYSGKKEHICVDIKECGSVLQWEYEVDNNTIGFGLYFKESEEEHKEILPVHRISTPDGTEIDSYKCPEAGTYVFIFDNTFSWFKAKEISYCITVEEPESESSTDIANDALQL